VSSKVVLFIELCSLTLGIICQTAFGYDISLNSPAFAEVREDVKLITQEMNSRMADPTDWWYKLDSHRIASYAPAQTRMRLIATQIIHARIEEKASINDGDVDTKSFEARDLLDMMMQQGQTNEKQILDQLFTFLGAGHDTTSSSLQWTLLELAKRPEEMKKCQDAVDSILSDDFVAYDNLAALNNSYLNQVLKECLRLHPAVPMFGRITTAPCELGPYLVPAQTNIIIAVMALNRSEQWWDSPNDFFPGRWIAPLKHPFQFIPFSAGARNCIGQRFAQVTRLFCT
jgi:cytochrome P450